MKHSLLFVLLGALLSGCSLIPDYQQPAASLPAAYPQGPAYGSQLEGPRSAEATGWRDFFKDPGLQRLTQLALENNRDLRLAALNVEAYQAQFRIQRAELYPKLDANVSGTRQRLPADVSQTGERMINSQYEANLGIPAWELDLFGRLRALREQALENYLASEEARRAVQISLVASLANAYLQWRADEAQFQLAQETLDNYQKSYALIQRGYQQGATSALELRQAQTSVESARVSLAQYRRQLAQDQHALVLLLGTGLPADLPQATELNSAWLSQVPAGAPSALLQSRPDILQAEHQLRAANANIGAARAAFFPSVRLTGSTGSMSADLDGLFEGGTRTWLFAPSISLPIFNSGALSASLDLAEVQKDINVARYQQVIETAFAEVADGLAARGTYSEQLKAQQDLVRASEDYYRLADKRYRSGVDNYLLLLDAQRSLFSARQQLINSQLGQLSSEVNLYKALGGGWQAESR